MDENSSYREFISRLPKEELVDIICGSDSVPPILTRDEPKFSRPQLIWGIKIVCNLNFKDSEAMAENIINKIVGHKWDLLYNYDYFRFDIKKPGFWVSVLILFFSLYGIISFIIKVIEWIFR